MPPSQPAEVSAGKAEAPRFSSDTWSAASDGCRCSESRAQVTAVHQRNPGLQLMQRPIMLRSARWAVAVVLQLMRLRLLLLLLMPLLLLLLLLLLNHRRRPL